MSTPARATRRPPVLWEVLAVACLFFGYDRVASVGNVHASVAIRHGWAALNLERSLHIGVEHWANHWLAARVGLGRVLSVYYDIAHATVTFGVLLAVYVLFARGYRRARTALFTINGLALAAFLVLPVAPPRLLPGAGFVDVVAHSGTWGAWEAGGSTVAEHADRFAAMPSLHAAWAVWVVRAVWGMTRSLWARGLAGAHLAVTVAVILATGNHYVLDVAGGALLAGMAWWVSGFPWRTAAAALPQRRLPAAGRPAPAEAEAGR